MKPVQSAKKSPALDRYAIVELRAQQSLSAVEIAALLTQ